MKTFTLSALTTALLAGSTLAHPVDLGKRTDDPNIDVAILQFALTLEHLENAFYQDAFKAFKLEDFLKAGFDEAFFLNLQFIAGDEAAHVTFLEGAITSAGETPVKPCTYNFPVTDVTSFVTLSAILESVGTSAYLGAAPLVTSKDILGAAASIMAVEAFHTSLQRSSLGAIGAPDPFATPLDGNAVFTLASQFIVSCPSDNPPLPFKAFPGLKVDAQTCFLEDGGSDSGNQTGSKDYQYMNWNSVSESSSYESPSMTHTMNSGSHSMMDSGKTTTTDSNKHMMEPSKTAMDSKTTTDSMTTTDSNKHMMDSGKTTTTDSSKSSAPTSSNSDSHSMMDLGMITTTSSAAETSSTSSSTMTQETWAMVTPPADDMSSTDKTDEGSYSPTYYDWTAVTTTSEWNAMQTPPAKPVEPAQDYTYSTESAPALPTITNSDYPSPTPSMAAEYQYARRSSLDERTDCQQSIPKSCPAPSAGASIKLIPDTSSVKDFNKDMPIFVTFLGGLSVISTPAKIGGDGSINVAIPGGIGGQVFILITSKDISGGKVNDADVLFGPAILEVAPAVPSLSS